jgi:hypothetical protein
MTREQQGGHGAVVAGEGELLLHELHPHAACGEAADGRAQVVEVAGQAVHGVHEDGVAVADEGEHRLQLRAMEVFAGDVVGEGPVEFDAVELAIGVLVQGADPCVNPA